MTQTRLVEPTSPENILLMLDELDLQRGNSIMVLGCDSAPVSRKLAETGFNVMVLDSSQQAVRLENAEQTNFNQPEANSQENEGLDYTFPYEHFDAVLALGFIEYQEWDRWVLQQIHAALKPGGYLVATAPNQFPLSFLLSPSWWAQKARRRLSPLYSKVFQRTPAASPCPAPDSVQRLYTARSLRRILDDIEFKMLSVQSYGYAPNNHGLPTPPSKAPVSVNKTLSCLSHRLVPGDYHSGNTLVVLCRKSNAEEYAQDNLNNAARHTLISRFQQEQQGPLSSLKNWTSRHPVLVPSKAKELDLDSVKAPVLVLSPHPDDELIGCGGTLISLIEHDTEVVIVQLTDGRTSSGLRGRSEKEKETIRFAEARTVSGLLGAKELLTWPIPGEGLKSSSETVASMEAILRKAKPAWIFCPFINDPHPDHYEANIILAAALERLAPCDRPTKILWYQIWSMTPSNVYVSVDKTLAKKNRLLMEYATGMKPTDYIRFCKSLHAYDAKRLNTNAMFVESFLELDTTSFLEFMKQPENTFKNTN